MVIINFKNIIPIILILGLSIVIIYSTYAASVIGHENAHKIINSYFGVDSHIEYNSFGFGGATYPDSTFKNSEDRDAAFIAHGVNEAVGYQTAPFFLGIMAMQIIILAFFVLGGLNG